MTTHFSALGISLLFSFDTCVMIPKDLWTFFFLSSFYVNYDHFSLGGNCSLFAHTSMLSFIRCCGFKLEGVGMGSCRARTLMLMSTLRTDCQVGWNIERLKTRDGPTTQIETSKLCCSAVPTTILQSCSKLAYQLDECIGLLLFRLSQR
jgi:hypothetical protein